MQTKFPWYVIDSANHLVVAGFNREEDARAFCSANTAYEVQSICAIEVIHHHH